MEQDHIISAKNVLDATRKDEMEKRKAAAAAGKPFVADDAIDQAEKQVNLAHGRHSDAKKSLRNLKRMSQKRKTISKKQMTKSI
jgi:hypothetical protein